MYLTGMLLSSQSSVYLASTLSNFKRVQVIRDRLMTINISVTYDWTTHNDGQLYVSDPDGKRDTAKKELTGVLTAGCVLAIMPGEKGTHFELGLAYAAKKPIVILYNDGLGKWPCFHYLDGIVHTNDENHAIELVLEFLQGKRIANYPLLNSLLEMGS